MTTLQGKSCGPYLSASAMRFTKRRYTNVRPLPFLPLSLAVKHACMHGSLCVCADVLCVDAIIQTEEAHMELCRALRATRSASTRLRLRIGKLDMSSLGVPRTVVLLEQLDPEVESPRLYRVPTVLKGPEIGQRCLKSPEKVLNLASMYPKTKTVIK